MGVIPESKRIQFKMESCIMQIERADFKEKLQKEITRDLEDRLFLIEDRLRKLEKRASWRDKDGE